MINDARQVLLEGEEILDVTGGLVPVHRFGGDQGRRGTVVVTNRRVILQTKRVGGYDVQDFAYGLLSGCNYAIGAGFSTIELVMAGERVRVTQVLRGEARCIGPIIRNQLAQRSTDAQPQHSEMDLDPTARLRKLGEMREAELLTEEEFQAKRSQIIGQM